MSDNEEYRDRWLLEMLSLVGLAFTVSLLVLGVNAWLS